MELTKVFVMRCRNVGALRDFLCQAIDQVDAMEEERRWRKVSEELPPKDEWVFVIGNRMMQIAKMVEDGWIDDYYNYLNVTHWMPLPKPPEEQ